jgi:hypothetical protein
MDQRQKNTRKMYGNVLTWFGQAGAALLGVKLINTIVGKVTTDVANLDKEAKRQLASTTVMTRSRTEVKQEAAEKAEALRGLVLTLTTDTKLAGQLKKPVSNYLYGADATFLDYGDAVVAGIGTLDAEEMDDAGYDATLLTTLTTDLQALRDSSGEALLLQKATKAVTDKLPGLFDGIDLQLVRLDRLVNLQRFGRGELVDQYEALRVLPKTPATQRFRAKGATPFDVPQLAYSILEEDVPTPTFYNTGGRGHEVVFYLGATPTSRPRPGQGLLVKNGKKRLVEDYALLGDPATEPYVLVLQTSELPAGGWRVRG